MVLRGLLMMNGHDNNCRHTLKMPTSNNVIVQNNDGEGQIIVIWCETQIIIMRSKDNRMWWIIAETPNENYSCQIPSYYRSIIKLEADI